MRALAAPILSHLFVAVPQPAHRPVKGEHGSAARRRTLEGPSQAPVPSIGKRTAHLPIDSALICRATTQFASLTATKIRELQRIPNSCIRSSISVTFP